jgi:signal transduction histidine kinase/HAMP domain-containing protein
LGDGLHPPRLFRDTAMVKDAIHLLRRFVGTLRFKLSFYVGLVVFLTVVVFTYHSVSIQEQHLLNARVQGALKDSAVIKAAIWNGMMTKDREVIRQIVKAIGEQEGFKEINIYDWRGILHYTSNGSPTAVLGKRFNEGDNPLLKHIDSDTSVRYQFVDQEKLLNVVNPLVNTKSCSTAACHAHPESIAALGALEVKLPLEGLRTQIRHTAHETYIFAFLLFVLISTIVGLGVVFLVSRPLRRLRAIAMKLARGEYSPEAPRKGHDSIATLYRVFDQMSRQINERTRQLEQSRTMYKELFEKVPCYISVVDKDYRIVRENEAFRHEFGDQEGKHCFGGRKGLHSKCENCQVEKTFADGLSHRSEEVWNPDSSDKKAYVIVHTSPILDENGEVAEVMEMSLDVTRIVKLQLELAKREQEFQNLIENVPCYLTVVDPSFRIAFYNKIFAKDFGDRWGESCHMAYKGRDSKCENCPVEKTFADGATHTSEEVWHRNGEEVYIVTYTSPIINGTGEVEAVMEMCTNVTELKLLQNELAVLGETIAGMSHSVKNVLSGLEGGVYVVDSGLRSGRDDRVRLGWNMVKKNVEKVSDLVKDILYASKEREPEYQECDPAAILQEVYDLYEGKAKTKGIELIRDFEPSLDVALLDPKGIHSAVSNLVSNAIQACNTAGSGDHHHVRIGGRLENARLFIQVTDDGIGIPEHVRQNLFTKFYSTKGSKGTGLGLVVTRKIVEEHGGTIKVESAPGKGTTFLIEVPLKPAERNIASAAV